eukprot:3808883-Rhodomonas_salina.1
MSEFAERRGTSLLEHRTPRAAAGIAALEWAGPPADELCAGVGRTRGERKQGKRDRGEQEEEGGDLRRQERVRRGCAWGGFLGFLTTGTRIPS